MQYDSCVSILAITIITIMLIDSEANTVVRRKGRGFQNRDEGR
jgi:hypothetical protein